MKLFNHSIHRFGICFIAALFIGLHVQAQTSTEQDTLSINLEEAIEIALTESPSIKIANMEVKRVDYMKKEAWGGLIPSVDGTAQYIRTLKPQTMVMAGQSIAIGQDNTASLGLSLSLPLIVPALWKAIQMSDLGMQLAVEKAHASNITLIADVKKAYYNILLAQASYEIVKESYEIAKQNFELSKIQFEQGIASEYNFISAEIQMRNLTPSLLQTESFIVQAKMLLKVLIGLDSKSPLKIEGALSDFETKITGIPSINELVLDNNTNLKQLEIQKKQIEKQLQLQKLQFLPTLAAFGNFQYQGNGNDDDKIESFIGQPMLIPGGMTWYSPYISAGLQLNVPIFHGFTKVMKVKQTKIMANELLLQRDVLKNNLNIQLTNSISNMRTAFEQIESNKKNVELAEKGHDISQKRYDTGMGILLELQNSMLALTQAKLSYSQAIINYLNAKVELEQILGDDKE